MVANEAPLRMHVFKQIGPTCGGEGLGGDGEGLGGGGEGGLGGGGGGRRGGLGGGEGDAPPVPGRGPQSWQSVP